MSRLSRHSGNQTNYYTADVMDMHRGNKTNSADFVDKAPSKFVAPFCPKCQNVACLYSRGVFTPTAEEPQMTIDAK